MTHGPVRWREAESDMPFAPHVAAHLAREAVRQAPANPAPRLALARASAKIGAIDAAIDAYEAVIAQAPALFDEWGALAECHLQRDGAERALELCRLGQSAGAESARLRYCEGMALRMLGQPQAARAALDRAVALGDYRFEALNAILRPMARMADGAPLLDYCAALPSSLAQSALARACRSIALSRLGRVDEARALVDLDRHVIRVELEPPDGFASREEFHRALMAEIDRGSPAASAGETYIIYDLATDRRPVLRALHARIRDAIDAALAAPGMIGPGGLAEALPEEAVFGHGITLLRGDGCNGEHIHASSLISAVYHARVPPGLGEAGDRRGALTLGGVAAFTRGHRACWGERDVAPREGWLTLFPSHVFHDVVPTRLQAPRLSIPVDLQPG